jgi:DNA repair protein RecO (recombination protein O)
MIERATGIILRTRPLTETSLIVHWLTRESGRLATAAKGARRPTSPFRGQLDLFYLADLSFVRSRRSDLHTLREAVLREVHASVRRDLRALQLAAYAAALIEQATEADTPIPRVFELFLCLLRGLETQPPEPKLLFALESKLLAELGLQPKLTAVKLTPGSIQLLARLTTLDWEGIKQLRLSAAQVTELAQFLHGFLIYHLDRIPAGRADLLRE